jgi:hypothetical protein
VTVPLSSLLEQALALPTDERAQLAQQLLESLRESDFADDALQAEWEEEIARVTVQVPQLSEEDRRRDQIVI